MNRLIRSLAASALLYGAGLAPALAWQSADTASALIDLSPQSYPVSSVPRDAPSDVAPDAGSHAADEDAAFGIHYDRLFLDASMDAYGYWPGRTGLHWTGAATDPGVRLDPAASNGLDTWSLGERNWRYRSSDGYGVTLGSTESDAGAGGRSVRLAGVGLSSAVPPGRLMPGAWDYAVAAGALEAPSDRVVAEGDLAYGPAAFDATTRYALDHDLILASRLQSTQGMTAVGLGGNYSLGDAGAWRFGVSGSRQPQDQGWRRQLGYTVGLYPGLDLSWVNARQRAGYADLATYSDSGCDCVSNQWQLDLAAGRWGSLSGSFERRVDAAGGLDQQVGLAHGFRYGPRLGVRLESNRNLTSGAYGVGAHFSLSLD